MTTDLYKNFKKSRATRLQLVILCTVIKHVPYSILCEWHNSKPVKIFHHQITMRSCDAQDLYDLSCSMYGEITREKYSCQILAILVDTAKLNDRTLRLWRYYQVSFKTETIFGGMHCSRNLSKFSNIGAGKRIFLSESEDKKPAPNPVGILWFWRGEVNSKLDSGASQAWGFYE